MRRFGGAPPGRVAPIRSRGSRSRAAPRLAGAATGADGAGRRYQLTDGRRAREARDWGGELPIARFFRAGSAPARSRPR